MTFEYFGSLQCEFERRKPDGTTTLGLLHPVDPIVGGKFTDQNVHDLAIWQRAVARVTFSNSKPDTEQSNCMVIPRELG